MTATDVAALETSGLRLALDTNILVYAEGLHFTPGDVAKTGAARRLLAATGGSRHHPAASGAARALVRKAGVEPATARERVHLWAASSELVDTDEAVFETALALAADHGLQIFDAVILAAAGAARCDILLSEDLQDGFAWRGVVVSNPFGPTPDRRLGRLLDR